MEDAAELAEAGNNRNIWIRIRDRMPHPYTVADAQAYLDRVQQDKTGCVACIEIDGKVGGSIGLHPGEDVYRRTAELGYWVAEPYWGRGIATEAVRALVEYGFKNIPLDRIYASAYANNLASVRVLEKCGFQFEGRMRKNVIKDGVVLDSLLYAILRD